LWKDKHPSLDFLKKKSNKMIMAVKSNWLKMASFGLKEGYFLYFANKSDVIC